MCICVKTVCILIYMYRRIDRKRHAAITPVSPYTPLYTYYTCILRVPTRKMTRHRKVVAGSDQSIRRRYSPYMLPIRPKMAVNLCIGGV